MLLPLLFVAATAWQEPPPPAPAYDAPPRLLESPDLSRTMPRDALDAAVSGRATVQCRASVAGRLENCHVLEETPAGWGFGEAGLSALRYVRVQPAMRDGQPVELSVRLPVEFSNVASVKLDCALGADGGASDCRVAEELPTGRGLGALALAEAAANRPPAESTQRARDGRFGWWIDVVVPLEACPLIDGQPRCSAP